MLMFRPLDDLFRIIDDRRTDVVITEEKTESHSSAALSDIKLLFFFISFKHFLKILKNRLYW